MPAYRLPSPYDRQPLSRRASGLAFALGINLLLLLVLMTLGIIPAPERKPSSATVVDMIPEQHARQQQAASARPRSTPLAKPPPIILPVKPTIQPPPAQPKSAPWIEMSHDQMAAADVANLPQAGPSEGDSEEVGKGPHGEVLYAAEWARRPTDAELGGYLPRDFPDGFGLVACRTIPGNRVDDCVELDQWPHGSHLAAAVRQAAWQFRVRPPRKNGRAMIGEWVRIRIDYERISSSQ